MGDYHAARIDLHLGLQVEAILPTSKQVRADGKAITYDKLLLATGALARREPVFTGCLTLRSADDAAMMRDRLAAGQRVGIIGGGSSDWNWPRKRVGQARMCPYSWSAGRSWPALCRVRSQSLSRSVTEMRVSACIHMLQL